MIVRPGICDPMLFGEKISPVLVPPTTERGMLIGTPTLRVGRTAGKIVSVPPPPDPTMTTTSFDAALIPFAFPARTRTK